MRYYVTQYGYYWSLTKEEFIEVLKIMINKELEGYNLDKYREIKHKPRVSEYKIHDFSNFDADDDDDDLDDLKCLLEKVESGKYHEDLSNFSLENQ